MTKHRGRSAAFMRSINPHLRHKRHKKVSALARRKSYRGFKRSKRGMSRMSFAPILKIAAGATIAGLYEVYVSPKVPIPANIKTIVETIVGIALLVVPRMPMPVRAFGAAIATVNIYSYVYAWATGQQGGNSGSTLSIPDINS